MTATKMAPTARRECRESCHVKRRKAPDFQMQRQLRGWQTKNALRNVVQLPTSCLTTFQGTNIETLIYCIEKPFTGHPLQGFWEKGPKSRNNHQTGLTRARNLHSTAAYPYIQLEKPQVNSRTHAFLPDNLACKMKLLQQKTRNPAQLEDVPLRGHERPQTLVDASLSNWAFSSQPQCEMAGSSEPKKRAGGQKGSFFGRAA